MSLAQFFQQNLFLFILLFIVIGAIVVYEIKHRHAAGKRISVLSLAPLTNEGALLIDLRPATEFQKGHIAGAKNFPATTLNEQIAQIERLSKQSRTVVLYDENGLSVGNSAKTLLAANIGEVYTLQGGLDSWRAENLPLVK